MKKIYFKPLAEKVVIAAEPICQISGQAFTNIVIAASDPLNNGYLPGNFDPDSD